MYVAGVSVVIDHVGIRVSDLPSSRAMYEAALGQLGFFVLGEGEFEGDSYVLFGRGDSDDFSLHTVGGARGRDRVTTGAHTRSAPTMPMRSGAGTRPRSDTGRRTTASLEYVLSTAATTTPPLSSTAMATTSKRSITQWNRSTKASGPILPASTLGAVGAEAGAARTPRRARTPDRGARPRAGRMRAESTRPRAALLGRH